jgi:hypothetical protein
MFFLQTFLPECSRSKKVLLFIDLPLSLRATKSGLAYFKETLGGGQMFAVFIIILIISESSSIILALDEGGEGSR